MCSLKPSTPLNPLLLLLYSLLLSGCSTPSGHGGMAEHHLQTLLPVLSKQTLTPEHGLRFDFDFDLELAQRHLDILILEGGERCFPATIVQAKQRQQRIARELAGGLTHDAASDLIIQRQLLSRLEHQLDYVRQQNICSFLAQSNRENSHTPAPNK